MAKKKAVEEEKDYSEVVLSSGAVAIVHRIPATWWYLFEQAHEVPDPPLREAKVIGGGTEMVPDPENAEYKAVCDALKTREAEALHEFVLKHVELRDEPAPEVLEDLEQWDVDPTQRNLLLYHMKDHATDFALLHLEAKRISVVTGDEVQKALQRFRDQVGGPTEPDADGDTEEPVPGEE